MHSSQFQCYNSIESFLTKVEISNSEKLRWTQKHDPISVSISSKMPEYTKEICIIDDDCDNLTGKMVQYLEKVAITAYDNTKQNTH